MDFHERPLEDENLRGLILAGRGIVEGNLKKGADSKLSDELGRLGKYLQAISKKLQLAGTEIETASSQIPCGADQLNGVTRFTEEEVHRVLGIVEKVIESRDALAAQWETLKTDLPGEIFQRPRLKREAEEIGARLRSEKKLLMDLLTALSFQDVAAQWLRKISSDMTGVQSRIRRLNQSLNEKGTEGGSGTFPGERRERMPSKAGTLFSDSRKIAQADVDKLLKEHGL